MRIPAGLQRERQPVIDAHANSQVLKTWHITLEDLTAGTTLFSDHSRIVGFAQLRLRKDSRSACPVYNESRATDRALRPVSAALTARCVQGQRQR
jgi:hypothetical protein